MTLPPVSYKRYRFPPAFVGLEMAGRVVDKAVPIFGGRGYMRENVVERLNRECASTARKTLPQTNVRMFA